MNPPTRCRLGPIDSQAGDEDNAVVGNERTTSGNTRLPEGAMTEAVQQIMTTVQGLSREERAEIAYRVVVGLEEADEGDVTAAWDAELGRRLDDIRSGRVQGKPAEQFFSELREGRQ